MESILGAFWEPWAPFPDFLASLESVKIQRKKGRPKRSPEGPGMSASSPGVSAVSNGEKCVGPKRRASSHQAGPRSRPRPVPDPDQSPDPDQTQNQNQNQKTNMSSETLHVLEARWRMYIGMGKPGIQLSLLNYAARVMLCNL